jgi:DNA-binding CsgD family transcriptional regulator
MAENPAIVQGREAFARQTWGQAYEALSRADRVSPLEPADLERFAAAAYLVGREAEAVRAWTRAHHDFTDHGDVERAARCGFWLSLYMLLAGEMAQTTGWLARSQRLLKDREEACLEQGYGLIVTGLLAMGKGDAGSAGTIFKQAVALAERFGDADLLALGLLGRGQSLIQSNRPAAGIARLDEAMVAVTAGRVSPVLAGIVYCAVILDCQRLFDIRRAREWTRQLDSWCSAQPDLVPYRGQCLVHRSEILQLQGDWHEALAELQKARAHLAERSEAVVGRACYQQGELHRLRGEFAQAEEMYREACRFGCEPQPGLSLLRLAEGEADAAAASIRGAVESAGGLQGSGAGSSCPKLLGPCVEILVAAGDLDAARTAADELRQIATAIGAPSLLATSTQATGAVLFAEGKLKAALALLREAWALWQQLETPYEAARVRVLSGRVCQRLGDDETARMHIHVARSVFAQLGAAADQGELERLMANRGAGAPGALTDREREVLALVASGETNRQIAAKLGISEHTVARHLSNIFDKLGVTSRTAASAHFHKSRLVLRLPAPADFLWQYIHSTPIAAAAAEAGEANRSALERDVCAQWQDFMVDGSLSLEVGMTMAIGWK